MRRMDGIEWAASAMSGAQARLEIAAGNLANSSTDGFLKTVARGSLNRGGVRIAAEKDARQGALRHTGRASDLAIAGPGAFVVCARDGRHIETRDGAFTRDRSGKLRDDRGRVLIGYHLPRGSSVRSGFLESSNVDSIEEMIDILSAERSYEAAQKVVTAIDQTRERANSQMAQFK